MSKQHLSTAKRHAIWTVHGERCYLCNELCAFSETEIDHILPERLVGTPDLLHTLEKLGLDCKFDLTSYSNLLPAHKTCNQRKAGRVFRPSLLIQQELERANDKRGDVEQLVVKTEDKRKKDKVFADALILIEKGIFGVDDIERLSAAELSLREFDAPYREAERVHQPLMLTPQLEIIGQSATETIVRNYSMVGFDVYSMWSNE